MNLLQSLNEFHLLDLHVKIEHVYGDELKIAITGSMKFPTEEIVDGGKLISLVSPKEDSNE